MIKQLICIIAAVILFSSCTSEKEESNNIIKAEIASFSSRISFETNEEFINTYWSDNDIIGIFGSVDGSNIACHLVNGSNTKSGVFLPQNNNLDGEYLAYYPYSNDREIILSDNKLRGLTLPTEQNYIVDSPDCTSNLMISNTKSSSLVFRNVFSIIKLKIKSNSSEIIKNIVFRDNNGSQVSGKFEYDISNNDISFYDSKLMNTETITLNCNKESIVMEANKYKNFYIVVPSRNYENGFTVDINYSIGGSNKCITKSVGKNGVTLHQSIFYQLPSIDQLEETAPARTWGGFLLKGVTPKSGWFDVNKLYTNYFDENGDRGGDNLLCWIAASANIIDWWQASLAHSLIPESAPYGPFIQDGQPLPTGNSSRGQSNVYRYFEKHTVNLGGYAYNAIDWYLNNSKYIALRKKYENSTDIGGFYKNVYGDESHTEYLQYWGGGNKESAKKFFMSNIKRAIDNDYGINLNYSVSGSGHAITCWGYELADKEITSMLTADEQIVTYDKIEENNGNKLIKYVYITDSDDANVSPNNSLIRAGVMYRDNGDILIVYHDSSIKKLTSIIFAKFL